MGGIEPDAKVNVLLNGRTKLKRLGDLKPGDFVGQVESSHYFQVSEVRISRRELSGYKLVLESGEDIVVAEGTTLCGQYGGNLVADQKGEVLCLVNMGKFFDSLDGSRRTFMVEFQAPEKYWHELKRICRHSSAKHLDGGFKKKFYRYSEVLRFLARLQGELPTAHIVPGLKIGSCREDDFFDFSQASGRSDTLNGLFLPLFRICALSARGASQESLPAVVAFLGNSYSVESRKVISCERIRNDGPWAFPIFDEFRSDETHSKQRFSFTANGIPIFYPNQFISSWSARVTLSSQGQPTLPPMPTRDDLEQQRLKHGDLNSIYYSLQELAAPVPAKTKQEKEALVESMFQTFRSLAESAIDDDELVNALAEKVIALQRTRAIKS